jgi:hypothetical protein
MRRLTALLLAGSLILAGCAGTDDDGVPIAPTAPGFGETVGAVSCDAGGHDAAYHIHAQLAVILPDGTRADVPADIGISSRCMYWLHTHDTTGQLHVEAPDETLATLADFLEIWRRTANPTIADAVAAGLAEIRVMGEPVADAASVTLTDGLGIEIELSAFPER